MSSRSDVGLVLNREAWEMFRTAMVGDAELQTLLQDHTDDKRYDAETGARLFYWDSVKWGSYGDATVGKIEEMLDAMDLDEEETGACYRFIRLGDAETDVEDRGEFSDNPFDFGWSRKIDFSANTERV